MNIANVCIILSIHAKNYIKNQVIKESKRVFCLSVLTQGIERANQNITHDWYQNIMKTLSQLDISNKIASFSSTSFCLTNSISVDIWIIDLGASNHIICNEIFFSSSPKPHSSVPVRLPNGNVTSPKLA